MKIPGPPGRFCPWCVEKGKRRPMRGPLNGPVRVCTEHGEKTQEEIMEHYGRVMAGTKESSGD
jgi:hypothetical protein